MLKLIWLILDLLLIISILIRIPNNTGLQSILTKASFLGSPSSAEKFLDKITWLLICLYFFFAIKFNF